MKRVYHFPEISSKYCEKVKKETSLAALENALFELLNLKIRPRFSTPARLHIFSRFSIWRVYFGFEILRDRAKAAFFAEISLFSRAFIQF